MNRRMAITVAGVLLTFIPALVSAAEESWVTLAYISGMADAMAVTKTFCPPPGLHQKDLLVLVEKYLVRDVANQDAPASPRIMQLLRQTYPCSGGNRKNAPAKKGQDT